MARAEARLKDGGDAELLEWLRAGEERGAEALGVSPHHAQIRFEDCAFLLTDLGSAAGTFVNGVQVTEVILQDGDLIELGQGGPRLRFHLRAEEIASRKISLPLQPSAPSERIWNREC